MNGTELGDLGARRTGGDAGVDAGEQRVVLDAAARDRSAEGGVVRAAQDGDHSTRGEQGDVGAGGFPSLGSPSLPMGTVAIEAARPFPSLDVALPELSLPAPALRTQALSAPTRLPISNLDRRALALSSPRIIPSTPRTRFDLSNSPTSLNLSPIPLRPILHAASPQTKPAPEENDITEAPERYSPPNSPAFAPRHDDEPHPERTIHEARTPHPLYTPVPPRGRRRRRRKSKSIASGRTSKTGRSAKSRVKSAWRTVRRHKRRRDGGSSSSSSSSSQSSGSSTHGSSRSSSTWGGWRFWRNSSSGSSSSSSSSDDDEWEPPTPHFTLLTPCLTRPQLSYPSHLLPGAPLLDAPASNPVFDLITSSTLAPALERLQAFWLERRQDDVVSGDIGVGVSGAAVGPDQEEASYFAATSTPASGTPVATPGVGTGTGTGKTRLRGEARAARAEEKRFGKGGGVDDGPAWWLDVMCPTVADMRELRKILPLHPLTMEDILHQETREKIESFSSLGYYFIVFRALDETYFQYTSPDVSPVGSTANVAAGGETEGSKREKSQQLPGSSSGRGGRVDIVEGVGGKEGVEGVGVGAVNLYLIVFGDGILSFHFEDISKHVERVQGKMQQFGVSRSMSSHWIAYGLMDSIVDTFFPLIDFIEGESNEVDTFLSDPLSMPSTSLDPKVAPSGVGVVAGRRIYDKNVVGIVIEDAGASDREKASLDSSASSIRKATVKRTVVTSVLCGLSAIPLPAFVLRLFPESWTTSTTKTVQSTMLVDANGYEIYPLSGAENHLDYPHMDRGNGAAFDRATMLKRIADTRKLVTGLSRLLGPKLDVVRGLRKRTKEESSLMYRSGDSAHDIAIYIGDLFDHIIAMQQTLNFYDAVLSQAHPAYLDVLRLSLNGAKTGYSIALVKLTIVYLTFLPIMMLTGLFSGNVLVPHNGTREDHLLPDGTPAGYSAFGAVVGGVVFVAICMWGVIYLIIQSSRRQYRKKGLPTNR